MARIGILGAGSWGTALAKLLGERTNRITLWSHNPQVVDQVRQRRANETYLPNIALPDTVEITPEYSEACDEAEFVIVVVPSHVLREVIAEAAPYIPRDTYIVTATKGLDVETLKRASEIVRETVAADIPITALSGPSFAREVAEGDPTAVVAASEHTEAALRTQQLFNTERFRVYTNDDLVGVELAAALKNVIALAAGIAEGLGYRQNARAALITRGLAEMTRLGVALGARPVTFAGLAGLGDLVLTCTGDLSRNRTVGLRLGRGESLDEILAGMRMVAEGVRTARAARRLAETHAIEMPIVEEVHAILFDGKSPRRATDDLMLRAPKAEHRGAAHAS